jgi:hypothetical protein
LDNVGIKSLGLEHNGNYEWKDVESAKVDPEVCTSLEQVNEILLEILCG